MKALDIAETSALAARAVSFRNLVWITAKDRSNGTPVEAGFWNDVGTINIPVTDGLTGGFITRPFVGAGSLLQVEDVVSSADLSVKELRITLSGVDDQVANAVRGYDARLAKVQVYRLILNPTTGNAVAPARCRFLGLVDRLDIIDPREGGQGLVSLTVVSQLREISRSNPDMTSVDSQKPRGTYIGLGEDKFYEFTNAVTGWEIMWGEHAIKVDKKDKDDKDKDKKDK